MASSGMCQLSQASATLPRSASIRRSLGSPRLTCTETQSAPCLTPSSTVPTRVWCCRWATGRGRGKVDDEPDVLTRVAVRATHQTFVHQHRVRAARGHVVDGLAHVHQTLHSADGHAVVHGHDDRAPVFAVDDALQTDFFCRGTWENSFGVACRLVCRQSPSACGVALAVDRRQKN